jgi:hypothetical protein
MNIMNINWNDWIEEEKEDLNESELTNENFINFLEENNISYLNSEYGISLLPIGSVTIFKNILYST